MRLSIRYWLRRWLVPELEPSPQQDSADEEFWSALTQELRMSEIGQRITETGRTASVLVEFVDVPPAKGRLH